LRNIVSGIEIFSDPAGAELSARAQNPDSTSLVGIELASHYPTEPGKPKFNSPATDSGCGTWFGQKVFVNDW
jgi:hypothetical protein